MVLRLAHPVEEKISFNGMAVAESIVEVDPGAWTIVRDIVRKSCSAGGSGEKRRRLFSCDANFMKVVVPAAAKTVGDTTASSHLLLAKNLQIAVSRLMEVLGLGMI